MILQINNPNEKPINNDINEHITIIDTILDAVIIDFSSYSFITVVYKIFLSYLTYLCIYANHGRNDNKHQYLHLIQKLHVLVILKNSTGHYKIHI